MVEKIFSTRFVQQYNLHMKDGSILSLMEDYDKDGDDSFIERFSKLKQNEIIRIGDSTTGFFYVPMRNIVYVSTGDVTEVKFYGSKD